MTTRRQQIIELLKQRPLNIKNLAQKFGVHLKVVQEDLEHIRKSIKPQKLVIENAQCINCGFVFKDKKIKTPSKCPNCRAERIEPAKYSIK
jgi:predicted Zn-ribbon and HTH transcriptional regulator